MGKQSMFQVLDIGRHCICVHIRVYDNFKSFSCILFKFVMHVANNQFSDKFNNG